MLPRRVRYTLILGTKYSVGYVVLCYYEDEMPVFGKIKDIIITPSCECLLVLTPLVSTAFNGHLHAYEVSPLAHDTLIYRQRELADFNPLSVSKAFKSPSPMLVCMKYHVVY